MRDLVRLIVWMVADLFRSRTALEVEVWMLRQQINVLRRTAPKKHRAGFRLYWRCKSKARGGRPTVPLEVRKLIREVSIANPLRGAPRIHGELLKLGVGIGQTSVATYMAKRRGPVPIASDRDRASSL